MSRTVLWNIFVICLAVPLVLGMSGFLPFQVLVALVIIMTFLYRLRIGLAWAVLGGLIADSFTTTSHGALALALVLMALFVHWLLQTWFPARSILSGVLIGGMGTLVFEIIMRVSIAILFTLKFIPVQAILSASSLLAGLYNIIGCMITIGLFIFIIRKTSHRFHGAFLIRG